MLANDAHGPFSYPILIRVSVSKNLNLYWTISTSGNSAAFLVDNILMPSSRQSIGHSPLSRDHWTNLLSIASRYDFDDIRERAIKEISSFRPPLEPVRMVELALRHDVPQWLEPGYCALCQRQQPMNEAEVNKVGLHLAVKISRARDLLRRSKPKQQPQQARWKNPWEGNTFSDAEVRKVVRDTFWPFGPKS